MSTVLRKNTLAMLVRRLVHLVPATFPHIHHHGVQEMRECKSPTSTCNHRVCSLSTRKPPSLLHPTRSSLPPRPSRRAHGKSGRISCSPDRGAPRTGSRCVHIATVTLSRSHFFGMQPYQGKCKDCKSTVTQNKAKYCHGASCC